MQIYKTTSGLGYKEYRYLIHIIDDKYLCIDELLRQSYSKINTIEKYEDHELELVVSSDFGNKEVVEELFLLLKTK
jgi:hypothetical protein